MGLATGLMIASLVGTGIQAVGGIKSANAMKKAGEQQRDAMESQADLADFNANVANLQADDAVLRGQLEEQRYRGLVRGAVGAQRAGFAAGNIDISTGSAVDVQADAAVLGELDALTIRSNARREAWGYQVAASDYTKRGEIARKEGVYLEKAGGSQATAQRISTAAGIVSSGSSLLAQRYGFGGTGRT